MSSSLIQIWSVLGTIWTSLFTSWKIPLLNFTPATLVFGVLSFFVAIKFIHGIFTITVGGVDLSADREWYVGSKLRYGQGRAMASRSHAQQKVHENNLRFR